MQLTGTAEEAQNVILTLAGIDQVKDPDGYDYGPESLDDIECTEDGLKFAASVSYEEYHIDYTAVEESRIREFRPASRSTPDMDSSIAEEDTDIELG
jgi:hypothetical protein